MEREHIGYVYSNLDHKLEKDIVEKLNKANTKATHSAWNFCGYIYKDGNKYKEDIWVYHNLEKTLENDNIEDLIEEANNEFGWD